MWFKSGFAIPAVAALCLGFIGGTTPALADLGDQLFKLLADDGTEGDIFGVPVAIHGVTAIVGAQRDDDNGTNSGSAYLFDTATGQQLCKLLPNDGTSGDRFGSSVAISGKIVIVGAHRNDENGVWSGSAYLFDISDPTNPRQIAKLLADDGAEGDAFGRRVGISDAIAIVGAPLNNDNGKASGSAYIFDISDPAKPVQIAKLLPNDGEEDDGFGHDVAIIGTAVIVGAAFHDHKGIDSGSTYLFDATTGRQIVEFLPNDSEAGDLFGISIATRSTIAIVGAFGADDNGFGSGSAYLFDLSDRKNPAQITKLLPDDGMAEDRFGVDVEIGGIPGNETAIVGAWRDDTKNGVNSGSAYLFEATTGHQIAKLLPNDGAAGDGFGSAVGSNGVPGYQTIIVGSGFDDDNGEDSGSAYLFDASFCPWDLDGSDSVGLPDLLALLADWGPCKGCPADFDGDGSVGLSDLLALLANWGPCP